MNLVRTFVLRCEAVKNNPKTTKLNRITNRTMTNRRLRIKQPGIPGHRLVP